MKKSIIISIVLLGIAFSSCQKGERVFPVNRVELISGSHVLVTTSDTTLHVNSMRRVLHIKGSGLKLFNMSPNIEAEVKVNEKIMNLPIMEQ